MECPSCLRQLDKQRTPHGYIWACSGCGGRSLTFPVLHNAGARPEFIKALRHEMVASGALGTRACPHCGRLMRQARVEMLVDTLLLDVCPTCKAVWFDPAEFHSVPREPRLPTTAERDRMSPEAREALAILRVQHEARRQAAHADADGPEETWQWIPAMCGLPVVIDEPAVNRRIWLTWTLVALCAAGYLATMRSKVGPSMAVQEWGFIPLAWERHDLMTLVTSFFLHGGLFHLIGNAWALWVFGQGVEDRLGALGFGLLLAAGHVAGLILHAGFTPWPELPCVGASAGISAVLAFYAVVFPKVRLGMLIWYHWVRFSVAWGMIFYAILQLLGIFSQIVGRGHVSYLGHVGGIVVGICAAGIYRGSSKFDAPAD